MGRPLDSSGKEQESALSSTGVGEVRSDLPFDVRREEIEQSIKDTEAAAV
jgi:hypothetical protein